MIPSMIENCPNMHNQKTIETELENNGEQIKPAHNRSVYVIGSPWRENWVNKEAVLWLAPRPAPAPPGDSLLVSRFLPTRE